jgi:hypothetical protein
MPPADPAPALTLVCLERTSAALDAGGAALVRELCVSAPAGLARGRVRFSLAGVEPAPEPLERPLEPIPPGGSLALDARDVVLPLAVLTGASERRTVELAAELLDETGTVLARAVARVVVLPASHWAWGGVAPESLAAFVTPNAPELVELARDAARRLEARTQSGALDGYQSGSPERAQRIAEACCEALAARATEYVGGRPSFEPDGQKLRTAGEVVDEGLGNCLDLACACAALWELAGLNAFVIVGDGHALCGFFTSDERYAEPAHEGLPRTRNRLQLGELRVLEATLLCGAQASFAAALEGGERWLAGASESVWVVDIGAARRAGVHPLAERLARGGAGESLRREPRVEPWVLREPLGSRAAPRRAERGERERRLDGWVVRLLDLTLRNRLLNDRWEASGVPLLLEGEAAMAALEDVLWDEQRLRLVPRAGRTAPLAGDDASAELARGWVPAELEGETLYQRATKLYREGRSSLEETGARSLYAGVGFLEYSVAGRPGPLRAPLLLVPVELERISRSEGYRVRPLPDDTVVNSALSEYMAQVHGLDLGLAAGLPEDERGVDVAQLFARVRQAVKDVPGFGVLARAKLSTWTFKKLPLVEELRAREGELLAHPLVSTLLARGGDASSAGGLPGPESVDARVARAHMRLPLPADSSQLAAVLAALSGASFVLQGPPGTGKSQTIANLLSEALARGVRVLFLAEKSAALQVVFKRLEQVGLAEHTLNLHAEHATKAGFVAQIKAALDGLDARAAPGSKRFQAVGLAFDESAARLARVRELLHGAQEVELSLFDALDVAAAARVRLGREPPRLPGALATPLARAQVEALGVAAARLAHAWSQVPPEAARELADMDCTRALDGEGRRAAAEVLRELAATLERWAGAAQELAATLGLPVPGDAQGARALLALARLVVDEHACAAALVRALAAPDAAARFEALARALEVERAAQATQAAALARYDARALELPITALLGELRASRTQFFVSAWLARRRVRRALAPWAKSPPGAGVEALLGEVALLADAADARAARAPHAPALAELCAAGAAVDVPEVARRLEAARALQAQLGAADAAVSAALAGLPQALGRRAAARAPLAALEGALERAAVLRAQLRDLLALASEPAGDLALERARCARWLARESAWEPWSAYAAARHAAPGLLGLARALEAGEAAVPEAATIAVGGALRAWLETRLRSDLDLAECGGERAQASRAELAQRAARYAEGVGDAVDTAVRERVRSALEAAQADPARRDAVRSLNQLRAQTTMRRAIRRVMREAAPALVELKPIVLASPLSAATYLPPDFPPFDLVVIDEASQVPVWDAACALSRGRCAVVVGDSKQLPPTSFFDRGESGEREDEEELETLESVLDECVAAGLPQLSLLWHYRSRDERLIEYANRRSYGARLQTFPAPRRAHPNLGVEFRHVRGVYDRAGTATNAIEARAVVDEIVRRLRDEDDCNANRSLGVVTFSVAQQTLVQDLLDAALDAEPELAARAAREGEELFVKNLESVQGDERATMLFSVGYGPDAAGRVHYNFGPLTTAGGERRLNVAITRAREKVVVFASLRAADLDPARCRSRGVQDLRGYLAYAESGLLPEAADGERSPRRAVEPGALERELARALEARGWRVDLHVGRSRDYRISLALGTPEDPERWVLGVELDGLHWAAAPSVVDRELVRASVLAGLGWSVLRVAALDAWRDPAASVERIDAAARAAR